VGWGGVFQHTVEMARQLAGRGTTAIIHTASDHEDLGQLSVEFCGCVRCHRDLRSRSHRAAAIGTDYLGRTLSHLSRQSKDDVVHVQGLFGSLLYAPTIERLRRTAARAVFSPHNTFSRSGRRYKEATLKWACRRASAVVAFCHADGADLAGWGARPVVCPLVQYVPPDAAELVGAWRDRLHAGSPNPVVMVPGQIRPDKGTDAVLRAAALVGQPLTIAVVGEDRGGLSGARQIADRLQLPVNWIIGYQDLADFAAAISAADVVVAPYGRASQSGVLALASQLGTPSIAFPSGGLQEYATFTTARPDGESLASVMNSFLAGDRAPLRTMPPLEPCLTEWYARG
jgi:glycosyltransferase involved in cell wall biosynthesis